MTEWEAKYKALVAGIDDENYIATAEKIVKVALNLSLASPLTFEQAFYAVLRVTSLQQGQKTFTLLSRSRSICWRLRLKAKMLWPRFAAWLRLRLDK